MGRVWGCCVQLQLLHTTQNKSQHDEIIKMTVRAISTQAVEKLQLANKYLKAPTGEQISIYSGPTAQLAAKCIVSHSPPDLLKRLEEV